MSKKSDIAELTALEMLRHFSSGELSPVEAAEACWKQIEKHNDKVNAFNYLDEDETMEAARRSEERWRRGAPLGLIDGVPLAIKDMLATRGHPNRKGSTIIPDTPGEVDSPTIASLRRHGFVPMGRTTAPEFGWKGVTDSKLDGVTGNPWDPDKTAGGSSGGSAAAVPLGMAPLALGTDAGGSIRIPAAFSGLVGHKPTHGLLPMWPPSAFFPLAHVGPMTWTVADTALLMDVLAEPDPRDSTLPESEGGFLEALEDGDLAGLKVAYSPTFGYVDIVDPEIRTRVDAAAQVLVDLGARVEQVDPGFEDPLEAFNRMFYGGAANALRDVRSEQRAKMDEGLIEVAEWAEKLSMLDYLEAANVRAALIEKTSLFHQDWDVLVTPALPIPAFKGGLEVPEGWPEKRWPTWTPFSYPFNLTGQPAISVPCGFTEAGLPIGLQIVGARHADHLVLRVAHLYQQAAPLTHIRPKI